MLTLRWRAALAPWDSPDQCAFIGDEVVASREKRVRAFDLHTGALRWERTLPGPVTVLAGGAATFLVVHAGTTAEDQLLGLAPGGRVVRRRPGGLDVHLRQAWWCNGGFVMGGDTLDEPKRRTVIQWVNEGDLQVAARWPCEVTYSAYQLGAVFTVSEFVPGVTSVELATGEVQRFEVPASYHVFTDGEALALVEREAPDPALRVLDATTGETRWRVPVPYQEVVGVGAGVVVHSEDAGGGQQRIVARDARSGEVHWRMARSFSNDVLANFVGDKLLVYAKDVGLFLLSPTNGAELGFLETEFLYGFHFALWVPGGVVISGGGLACYDIASP
jgi:outer membrane protein assembly factor BamB